MQYWDTGLDQPATLLQMENVIALSSSFFIFSIRLGLTQRQGDCYLALFQGEPIAMYRRRSRAVPRLTNLRMCHTGQLSM